MAAGAPPQTPLGQLTALPRPPSCDGLRSRSVDTLPGFSQPPPTEILEMSVPDGDWMNHCVLPPLDFTSGYGPECKQLWS